LAPDRGGGSPGGSCCVARRPSLGNLPQPSRSRWRRALLRDTGRVRRGVGTSESSLVRTPWVDRDLSTRVRVPRPGRDRARIPAVGPVSGAGPDLPARPRILLLPWTAVGSVVLHR